MGINKTFAALSISRILGNTPFYVSKPYDDNTFKDSFFSHSLNPLFLLKQASKLSLIKSSFTNLKSSIVVALRDTDSSFYENQKNGQITENLTLTGTGSGLLVQESTAYNLDLTGAMALFYSTGPRIHINTSTFVNISLPQAGIVYADGASEVRISESIVQNCTGIKAGVGYFVDTEVTITKSTFLNCVTKAATSSTGNTGNTDGTTTDTSGNTNTPSGTSSTGANTDNTPSTGTNTGRRILEVTTADTTTQYAYFYFKNTDSTIARSYIKINETIESSTSTNFVGFESCRAINISSSEFTGLNQNQPVIIMKDSTRALLFATAFVNITATPLSLTNSALAVLRTCSASEKAVASSDDSSIITTKNYTTNDSCNLAYIIVPDEDTEETLTDAEKIAQWVTFGFFIVFFVTVFATLISLVFCKVGLSEELNFEESQHDEEESFQSFAA